MNPLQQDFDRLRCAGTPWCLILTPDYRECMRSLCKMQAERLCRAPDELQLILIPVFASSASSAAIFNTVL